MRNSLGDEAVERGERTEEWKGAWSSIRGEGAGLADGMGVRLAGRGALGNGIEK